MNLTFLQNKVKSYRENVVNYNFDLLLTSCLDLQFNFFFFSYFFVILWFLFYRNFEFSKKIIKNSFFDSVNKNIFLLLSVLIGIFYVVPCLVFKLIYFDIEDEFNLLIYFYHSIIRRINFYLSIKYLNLNNKNYPSELIISNFFIKQK